MSSEFAELHLARVRLLQEAVAVFVERLPVFLEGDLMQAFPVSMGLFLRQFEQALLRQASEGSVLPEEERESVERRGERVIQVVVPE